MQLDWIERDTGEPRNKVIDGWEIHIILKPHWRLKWRVENGSLVGNEANFM